MNNLSWLIYLADVVDTLNGFALTVTVLSLIGTVVFTIIGVVGVGSMYEAENKSCRALCRAFLPWFAPLFFLFAILTAALPARETVYAIAASEMGEQVLQTPTATKATAAINAWLDKQIAGAVVEKEGTK